jgi:acyl-CoA synthetase (NDP forming)
MESTRSLGIKYVFEPKSVAVVGASGDKSKYGYFLMKNLLDLGYNGKIYPVNRKREKVLGLRCYPSVDAIPDDIETTIILIPASHTLQVINDCARKKVKSVIICTSGFREIGKEGFEIENKIIEVAHKAGIRVIGPNTTGVLNAVNGFTSSFVKIPKPKIGSASIIAQTGMFASVLSDYIISNQPFGISKIVGLGNKADVDDADVLDYLLQDKDTKVIAIYMEGVKNGRRLYNIAKKVTKKKPILVLKSAYSRYGGEASLTHTGSLMVRDNIFEAVCKGSGMIRVDDIEEMFDYLKAFSFLPLPKKNRIAVIAYTGAGCVMSADACNKYGLKLAEFSKTTMSKLMKNAPSFGKIRNPIDAELLRQGMGYMNSSLNFALETILEDENVDAISIVLIGLSTAKELLNINVENIFSKIKKKYPKKPIVVTTIGGKEIVDDQKEKFERFGIPFYPSLLRNIRALSALCKYNEIICRKS